MKVKLSSIAALVATATCHPSSVVATCPDNLYPEVSSDDEDGIPYLNGPCHTYGKIYMSICADILFVVLLMYHAHFFYFLFYQLSIIALWILYDMSVILCTLLLAPNNDARNVVIATWVLNDGTWGPGGLNAETPQVVRWTWYQQFTLHQAIAATKMGNMQSRFKKDDGSYDVPPYKLDEVEIQCFYDAGNQLLDQFRATIHASVSMMRESFVIECVSLITNQLNAYHIFIGNEEMDRL
jgi:hypothetical protein